MTLKNLLSERAGKYGDKTFMYFRDREFSYNEINDAANRVGRGLAKLGVRKGGKVCLLIENRPEFVISFFGPHKIGAVPVPINSNFKASEVEYIAANSGATAIIASPEFMDLVRKVQSRVSALKHIIVLGDDLYGALPFDALLAEEAQEPEASVLPEDTAAIIYTSGTTGKPKGAVLTHNNYCFDAESIVEGIKLTEADRLMCILPLYHTNGHVVTLVSPLMAGASMVLAEGFTPSTFFASLERYQVTGFSAVPTVYLILLDLPDGSLHDLSRLRMGLCGAAPMPVEVLTEFEKRFRIPIIEGYGLSEGTCASCINPPDGNRKIGSVGLPLQGHEMEIVDERGNRLGPGEVGEIRMRGRQVMKGYYKNPEATSEAIRDGWLHTGDFGRRDEDGFFYIMGRKKDMILRGGANVYPKEVEDALYEHPAVKEAAVIGLPHKMWGEEVVACVILKDRARASQEELIYHTQKHLADYKCPKQVFFMKDFPRTATGKVRKRMLVEQVLKEE